MSSLLSGWRFRAIAALALLALPLTGRADYAPGTRVPPPTAAGQTLVPGVTAPFSWQLGTLPYTTTGSPGDYTATFPGPVVASPTGTAENGLTVTMPSGSTGYGYVQKDSVGNLLFTTQPQSFTVYRSGTPSSYTSYANAGINAAAGVGMTLQASTFLLRGGPITLGQGVTGINNTTQSVLVCSTSASLVPLSVEGYTGQTADLLDFNSSTGAKSAFVDKSFNANFPGYSQAVRTVSAADTATLSDSVILINGAFNETLPTTGVPVGRTFTVKEINANGGGGVTASVDGVNGYSLAANQFVQVVYGGASGYYKIGGN